VFCSKCGAKLPEGAYFCPKCGVRTRKGVEAGVSVSWAEVKEEFSKIGEEIEQAFMTAGKEIEKAFKSARKSIRESIRDKAVGCSHCGEKNSSDAKFCYNCGKELGQSP
jgi:ribosomal protein L40E